jgi:hypothetical protein
LGTHNPHEWTNVAILLKNAMLGSLARVRSTGCGPFPGAEGAKDGIMVSVDRLLTEPGRLTVRVARIDFYALPVQKVDDFVSIAPAAISFADVASVGVFHANENNPLHQRVSLRRPNILGGQNEESREL